MKKSTVLYLRVKHLQYLGNLIQTLHRYFSETMKNTGKNHHGLSFPEINEHNTGTLVGVHHLEKPETLLTFMPLMKMMAASQVSFENMVDFDLTTHQHFAAFIRDRRLERGAPPQAMARFHASKNEYKQQTAQARMSRYFEKGLPQISMESQSSKRQFTLNIATITGDEASPVDSVLNSYGLSSYQSPVFLPVFEVEHANC